MNNVDVIFKALKMVLDGLLNFIQLIPNGLAYITQALTIVPAEIATYIVCVVSTSIVLMLLGRNS